MRKPVMKIKKGAKTASKPLKSQSEGFSASKKASKNK